jgi:magnesium-transporting ATPase (P-type)
MDVPLLDASAIAASLLLKNTNSAATLLMLLKTGQYLEEWAKERSRENLAAELSIKAGTVWVKRDGVEREVPYSAITGGDLIVLRAGTVVPVDGKTVKGDAVINEAALTGEPLGAEKRRGDTVYAGTLVEDRRLIFRNYPCGAVEFRARCYVFPAYKVSRAGARAIRSGRTPDLLRIEHISPERVCFALYGAYFVYQTPFIPENTVERTFFFQRQPRPVFPIDPAAVNRYKFVPLHIKAS